MSVWSQSRMNMRKILRLAVASVSASGAALAAAAVVAQPGRLARRTSGLDRLVLTLSFVCLGILVDFGSCAGRKTGATCIPVAEPDRSGVLDRTEGRQTRHDHRRTPHSAAWD